MHEISNLFDHDSCTYVKNQFIGLGLLEYSEYMCMPVSGREERAGLSKLVCNLLGLILCEMRERNPVNKRPRVMVQKFVDDRSN